MNKLSPSKGISRGQIGKLQEMLGHGILKSTVFQNTLTAEVDRFVKKVGPDLRNAWVELLEKRFWDFIDIFCVQVNYDEPEAIAKAIERAKFDWKYVGLSPAEIPLGGTGQVARGVREVYFGRRMYNHDLPNALKQRGEELGFQGVFKFADSLTALHFAGANPDRQREHPLAILFTDSFGQLWYLCLREYGGRSLDVHRGNPDGSWGGRVGFLAVCE